MKTTVDPKKTVILSVFGIVAIILAGINRFFLENIVMSAIVVTLSAFFLVAFVWIYVSSRRAAVKTHPKRTKHPEEQEKQVQR